MRSSIRILTMAACLAALSSSALAAGAAFDPTPKIPLKVEPADRTRFIEFDATRLRTVPAALAGAEGNDAVALQKILAGDPVAIGGDRDLLGQWRCRSAQLDDGSKAADHKGGAYVYPYFKCAIRKKDGKLFFEKLNGSQRVSGFLYRVRDDRYAFLGGTDLADDPQVPYGYAADRNVVAYLFKISDKRLRLEMPNTCCSNLEILELVR